MRVKISDIVKFSKGVQINGDDLIDDGEYIYLNGGINPSGRWNSANVAGNTVTISEGGNSSGYINYITEAFWCGAHCYYLYDGPKNTRYLYYALKSQQDRLFSIRSGACMPNIKKADLGKFEFEYDYDEQNQENIVSVLSKTEMIISARKRELELLDDLIKARFVELFGSTDQPKWATESFESNVYFQEGPGVRKWQFRTEGIKLINIKNVVNDKLDLSNTDKYLSVDEVNEKYTHFLLNPGDYVMASSGVTWGKIAEVKAEHLPLCLNTSMIRLVPKERIIKQYLFYFIKSNFFRNQINRLITGSAQPNFGPSHLMKIEIPVPPIDIQEKFAKEVQQVDKSKVVVQKALDEAQLLFDSLMQEYFG